MLTTVPINFDRLWTRVHTLSEFTRKDIPWTRRAFTREFATGRDWLVSQYEEAGLQIRRDEGGNLIGRRAGSEPALPPLVSGSHSDTVMGGGRFDGIIGTLAALEVAHALRDAGCRLRHDFEVVDFLSEEPSDYGVSCVGSRAMSGRLDAEMLRARNQDGETLVDAIGRVGGNMRSASYAPRQAGSVAAFIELHIEQGPVLESRGIPIGAVTNIVGIRRVAIKVSGQPDHAGTTPMDLRRDALVGAARLIDKAHRMATLLSGKPHYVVATIGRLSLTPNVPNAVPGTVDMILEVRSDNAEVLREFPQGLLRACATSLAELRVSASFEELTFGAPTDCAAPVVKCIEDVAARLGLPSMRMPSGAGHDAVYMAGLCPAGMIFIPCLHGRSHCPEEWIDQPQLDAGAAVLAECLIELDRAL
ncbi:MAG: Zn-dependent hydrolase [Janthinobacterium lividum]